MFSFFFFQENAAYEEDQPKAEGETEKGGKKAKKYKEAKNWQRLTQGKGKIGDSGW